jgi:hypothetical protein
MSGFRFSLLSFIAVITLLAAGLGAMASQSRLATSTAYTLFVIAVGWTAVAALIPGLPNRAFCAGFAVFGLMYWYLEIRPLDTSATQWPSGYVAGTTGSVATEPQLVTRDLVHWLALNVSQRFAVGMHVQARWNDNGRYYPARVTQIQGTQYEIQWDSGGTLQWTPLAGLVADDPSILVAGHALVGSLFAIFGVLAAFFAGRKSPEQRTPS